MSDSICPDCDWHTDETGKTVCLCYGQKHKPDCQYNGIAADCTKMKGTNNEQRT